MDDDAIADQRMLDAGMHADVAAAPNRNGLGNHRAGGYDCAAADLGAGPITAPGSTTTSLSSRASGWMVDRVGPPEPRQLPLGKRLRISMGEIAPVRRVRVLRLEHGHIGWNLSGVSSAAQAGGGPGRGEVS